MLGPKTGMYILILVNFTYPLINTIPFSLCGTVFKIVKQTLKPWHYKKKEIKYKLLLRWLLLWFKLQSMRA